METVRKSAAALFLITALSACQEGGERAETPSAPLLEVGDPAPEFALPDARQGKVSLSEYRGKKAVLLYFSMGPG
jgi:hypothetical protein